MFFWLFSPKLKNEQHTTDNEIKLHETDRKMNSKTDILYSLFAFTAERGAVECKGKHKHQKKRELKQNPKKKLRKKIH